MWRQGVPWRPTVHSAVHEDRMWKVANWCSEWRLNRNHLRQHVSTFHLNTCHLLCVKAIYVLYGFSGQRQSGQLAFKKFSRSHSVSIAQSVGLNHEPHIPRFQFIKCIVCIAFNSLVGEDPVHNFVFQSDTNEFYAFILFVVCLRNTLWSTIFHFFPLIFYINIAWMYRQQVPFSLCVYFQFI